jgi:hypothetical protein
VPNNETSAREWTRKVIQYCLFVMISLVCNVIKQGSNKRKCKYIILLIDLITKAIGKNICLLALIQEVKLTYLCRYSRHPGSRDYLMVALVIRNPSWKPILIPTVYLEVKYCKSQTLDAFHQFQATSLGIPGLFILWNEPLI